jgi:hypothetical protein
VLLFIYWPDSDSCYFFCSLRIFFVCESFVCGFKINLCLVYFYYFYFLFFMQVMSEKLLYAIFNCTEMDADFRTTEAEVAGWGGTTATATTAGAAGAVVAGGAGGGGGVSAAASSSGGGAAAAGAASGGSSAIDWQL